MKNNLSKPLTDYDLRSWPFYQLEAILTYKAHENRLGSIESLSKIYFSALPRNAKQSIEKIVTIVSIYIAANVDTNPTMTVSEL